MSLYRNAFVVVVVVALVFLAFESAMVPENGNFVTFLVSRRFRAAINVQAQKEFEHKADTDSDPLVTKFETTPSTTEATHSTTVEHHSQAVTETVEQIRNWSVVYNENDLYKMVQSIHNRHFVPPLNEKCKYRVPDAYIVGVAKSGTRELTDFMYMHPQIAIVRKKVTSKNYKLPTSLLRNENREKIENNMPCTFSNQVGLVKADSLLTQTEMPRHLKSINPNMKIIAITREPISRIVSQMAYWYYIKKRKKRGADFNKIINDLPDLDSSLRSTAGDLIMSKYVKMSIYEDGLKSYLNVFPRDQILVINSDMLKHDPVGVFKNVTSFLGLSTFPAEKFFVLNSERNFYCIRNVFIDSEMICYGLNRGQIKQPELQPETKQLLVDFFSQKNERFFKLLGERFEWKYDK